MWAPLIKQALIYALTHNYQCAFKVQCPLKPLFNACLQIGLFLFHEWRVLNCVIILSCKYTFFQCLDAATSSFVGSWNSELEYGRPYTVGQKAILIMAFWDWSRFIHDFEILEQQHGNDRSE